jgi:Fe-S cluster biogenesis protein NfuA/rhodanese-related sulfurtransferase
MKLPIEEFLKKRKESRPSYVFDLRDIDTYEKDHLAGAYNLPFENLEPNLARLPFSGDMLLYDGGEGTAGQAAKLLEDNGFSDFFYVEEGYETVREALQDSPYDIKLFTTKDDPPEVQKEVIQNLLDFEVNPRVAAHGGYFTLIEVADNNVYVELGGGCQGCGMADVTLRQGVEQRMKEVFPDMVALIDSTDHAGGDNPYYSPGK